MLRSAPSWLVALGALGLASSVEATVAPRDGGVDAVSTAAAEVVPAPRTAAPTLPAFPAAPSEIAVPENNPLELLPPRVHAALPLTVALHGRDMDPIDMCDRFRDAAEDRAWLVCPAGNAPARETFDWGGTEEDRLAALDAQLAAVETLYGALVDHARGDVLVGFSRGGFLARDLVYARPGRFRGMIVLGAAVKLDPDRLRAAGVKRVVLASGDLDGARPTMQHTALRLSANHVPARFVSLGPIYHVLPADLGPAMRDAIAWVRGES